MPYKHGVSGEIVPSQASFPPSGVGTLPVYVGTAPINQVADPSGAVNKVIIVNSFEDAKTKVGYSDDWATYTLCEAIYAHFMNPIKIIGPVCLICVFDPETDLKADTANVTLTNKVGYIDNESIVLADCAIVGKVLGTDFTAEYVTLDGKKQVKITDLTDAGIASPVSVTFNEMDITKVAAADIVGGYNAASEERTGLAVVDLIYQETGMIPTILAAPGWSEDPDVYAALISKCQDINGHWDAVCCVDIDSSATGAQTIADAKTWKATNAYTSKFAKVHWPMATYGSKKFHGSTLAVVGMQQTDFTKKNIPYESPSNKQTMCTGTVLSDGTVVKFTEQQAIDLNSVGITTFSYIGGQWKLYGTHMGNYTYAAEANIKPEDMFDCSIRMLHYVKNTFQKNYMSSVDGPFSRRKIISIIDEAQVWLNSLVAEGAALYGKIAFNSQGNPVGDIAKGDFVFDVGLTTTPPGKSITFKVQYDPAGLTALTE